MLLRKNIPTIEDLAIDEVKLCITFIPGYYENSNECKLVEEIKQHLNIKVSFHSQQSGKSDLCRMIEYINDAIDKLAENDQKLFKTYFLERLKSYPDFVEQKIIFACIDNRNIKYWILIFPTLFSMADGYVETIIHRNINGEWYKYKDRLLTKKIYNYDRIMKLIEILYCLMVINQFDFCNDIKQYIKCFCCPNIKQFSSIKFLI
jgi:hypothetical protein